MSDITREPWRFSAPDGLRSDLHGTAELQAAWEATVARVREQDATLAALRAELRQARELIRDLRDWHGHRGELILDAWERIASEFQADTGMLRPGKSQSPEACHSDEERQTRFREWCEARHNGLTGRIRIALHAAGLVED